MSFIVCNLTAGWNIWSNWFRKDLIWQHRSKLFIYTIGNSGGYKSCINSIQVVKDPLVSNYFIDTLKVLILRLSSVDKVELLQCKIVEKIVRKTSEWSIVGVSYTRQGSGLKRCKCFEDHLNWKTSKLSSSKYSTLGTRSWNLSEKWEGKPTR